MGDRYKMRPRESAHFLEYQYHQAITGTSHEDYLDAPLEHIRWMIEIHGAVKRVEAQEAKKEG